MCNYNFITVTYVHEFCGWPNTFLNGQILAEVRIWPYVLVPNFSYFELCIIINLVNKSDIISIIAYVYWLILYRLLNGYVYQLSNLQQILLLKSIIIMNLQLVGYL